MDVYTMASFITPYLRGKEKIHITQCEGKELLTIFYHKQVYQIVHCDGVWHVSNGSKGWYRTMKSINVWDDGEHVTIGMGKDVIRMSVGGVN